MTDEDLQDVRQHRRAARRELTFWRRVWLALIIMGVVSLIGAVLRFISSTATPDAAWRALGDVIRSVGLISFGWMYWRFSVYEALHRAYAARAVSLGMCPFEPLEQARALLKLTDRFDAPQESEVTTP